MRTALPALQLDSSTCSQMLGATIDLEGLQEMHAGSRLALQPFGARALDAGVSRSGQPGPDVQGFHDRRRDRIELLEFRKAYGGITNAPCGLLHKNARRLDRSRPPGGTKIRLAGVLEHAEHDGADKGEGEIRGENAQSADQRAKGHFKTSQVRVAVDSAERS